MKHLSVGEGPSFDISRLRGAADLAREDAERSEYLAQRCKEISRQAMDDPGDCDVCLDPLPENAKSLTCPRCRNREYMREARAEAKRNAPQKLPLGRRRITVTCWVCGAQVLKWGEDGTSARARRVCDGCVPKAASMGPAIRDRETA